MSRQGGHQRRSILLAMPGSHLEIDDRDLTARPFNDRKPDDKARATPQVGAALPPIYFYFPPGIDGGDIPASRGVFTRDRPGKYNWTVKTYGYLSRMGF